MDKWQEIQRRLVYLGGHVDLLADGYELNLRKVHNGKRIFVVVYINSELKDIWTEEKDGQPVYPEARFWRPRKQATYPKKHYKQLKRVFGKRKADDMITPKVIGFVPDFGTEGAVVAHLKKHFPDLEIKRETKGAEATTTETTAE